MATTLRDYDAMVADRPRKFDAEEVGYTEAPAGSAIRCSACLHYYHRAIDNFAVCEIFRPDDDGPVKPDWRCRFQTIDGDTFPLLDQE